MATDVAINQHYPHTEEHAKVDKLLADPAAIADGRERVRKALQENADLFGPKHGLKPVVLPLPTFGGATHT